jgi:hypothetical protein
MAFQVSFAIQNNIDFGPLRRGQISVARHARLRHDGGDPASSKRRDAPKKQMDENAPPLIRWSIQEVRRIANRLALT